MCRGPVIVPLLGPFTSLCIGKMNSLRVKGSQTVIYSLPVRYETAIRIGKTPVIAIIRLAIAESRTQCE